MPASSTSSGVRRWMHADTELVLKMACDQMLYVTLHGRSEFSSTNHASSSTNSGDPNSNLRALAGAAVDTPAEEEEKVEKAEEEAAAVIVIT